MTNQERVLIGYGGDRGGTEDSGRSRRHRGSPMLRSFDAIVIGAGQAGPSLAVRLAGAGWKVAFVERHLFGGTCVNTGCTPTKAMVASAHAAHLARRGRDFGVGAGEVTVDMRAVKARKDAIVMKSRTSV